MRHLKWRQKGWMDYSSGYEISQQAWVSLGMWGTKQMCHQVHWLFNGLKHGIRSMTKLALHLQYGYQEHSAKCTLGLSKQEASEFVVLHCTCIWRRKGNFLLIDTMLLVMTRTQLKIGWSNDCTISTSCSRNTRLQLPHPLGWWDYYVSGRGCSQIKLYIDHSKPGDLEGLYKLPV